MLVIDDTGIIVESNDRAAGIFDASGEEDLIGRPLSDFVPPSTAVSLVSGWSQPDDAEPAAPSWRSRRPPPRWLGSRSRSS